MVRTACVAHAALLAAIDAGETDADGNVNADYEFHARQFIRAVFAYIEAVTFSVKASSAWQCMEERIDISPQERYFKRWAIRLVSIHPENGEY